MHMHTYVYMGVVYNHMTPHCTCTCNTQVLCYKLWDDSI